MSDQPSAQAQAFLQQVLARGPVPATRVEAQAQAQGLNLRTLKRARQALGVIAQKKGRPGGAQHWELMLPETTAPPSGDDQPDLSQMNGALREPETTQQPPTLPTRVCPGCGGRMIGQPCIPQLDGSIPVQWHCTSCHRVQLQQTDRH